MTPRKWICAAVLVAAVIVALAACDAWGGSRLRSENYAQIQIGMTQAEVEELLGAPPGDYGKFLFERPGFPSLETLEDFTRRFPRWRYLSRAETWVDDRNRIVIWFDADNVVCAHRTTPGFHRVGVFKEMCSRLGIWY
jgi:hypothetical protein